MKSRNRKAWRRLRDRAFAFLRAASDGREEVEERAAVVWVENSEDGAEENPELLASRERPMAI